MTYSVLMGTLNPTHSLQVPDNRLHRFQQLVMSFLYQKLYGRKISCKWAPTIFDLSC